MRSVSNEERESCEAQWSWNSKWTNDERGYKYLGIVEMDKIKETDMKEKLHKNTEEDWSLFENRNWMVEIEY